MRRTATNHYGSEHDINANDYSNEHLWIADDHAESYNDEHNLDAAISHYDAAWLDHQRTPDDDTRNDLRAAVRAVYDAAATILGYNDAASFGHESGVYPGDPTRRQQ